MKNKHLLYLLALVGAVLLFPMASTMAMEHQGGAGGGPGPEGRGEEFMKKEEDSLGLTPEQRKQMKALREEGRPKQEALRKELKARHEAFRNELDGANPDRAKAETLAKEIGSLEEQMARNHIDQVLKIRSVLTPEQFQKLREKHKNMEKNMKKHWEKNGGEKSHHNKD